MGRTVILCCRIRVCSAVRGLSQRRWSIGGGGRMADIEFYFPVGGNSQILVLPSLTILGDEGGGVDGGWPRLGAGC